MVIQLLSELFTDKAVPLLLRDVAIAQSRVNAGVNYPSDIVGGRALAVALIFVLQDNPLFEKDLARAKAEIAAKKAAPAAPAK